MSIISSFIKMYFVENNVINVLDWTQLIKTIKSFMCNHSVVNMSIIRYLSKYISLSIMWQCFRLHCTSINCFT